MESSCADNLWHAGGEGMKAWRTEGIGSGIGEKEMHDI